MPVVYRVSDKDMSWGEALEKKLVNYFVVGIPRSGTTLAVTILEKAGVEMIWNRSNPHVKEITEAFFGSIFEMLSRPNTGCKLPILEKNLWMYIDLIKTVPCKVIYTYRDSNEVYESQVKAGYKDVSKVEIRGKWQLVYDILTARKTPLFVFNYNKLLESPLEECQRLSEFLTFGDPGIMASVVDKEKNHNKVVA